MASFLEVTAIDETDLIKVLTSTSRTVHNPYSNPPGEILVPAGTERLITLANLLLAFDAAGGVANLGAAQAFTALQTFSAGIATTTLTASVGVQTASTAITATADGLTTGIIPAGTGFVSITSADANHIVRLPVASVGTKIRGWVGANGFELRESVGAAVYINGVVCDDENEAAIQASKYFELDYVSDTKWLLRAWDALGAPITAIIPDA